MRYGPLLLFFIVGCLLAASSAGAENLDRSGLQGLGDTRYLPYQSETLGRRLHLYVRLPRPEEGSPVRRYPAVYMLDGGVNFPMLSAYYHNLRFGEEVPEMVLVGISYGSDTFEGGNYRSSDFTAPSEEREWWGDAAKFQAALEKELLPLIEANYPADPARRIIIGQSLAGQFVLFNALSRPDLFWGHISSNPALHRNLGYFLQWSGTGEMPVDATRLFVTEAQFNDSRFKGPASDWIEYWSAPDRRKPFLLEVRMLPGHTHLSAITESFRQGIDWLFR